jgi:hypothetical protein
MIDPLCSFNIYCHSRRVQEVRQTLRFLFRREPDLMASSEILLICQDRVEFPDLWPNLRMVNLDLPGFNKPAMVNAGVEESLSERIILLDCDRILPAGYFSRVVEEMMPGVVITPRLLYRLKRRYSDEEIEAGAVEKEEDFRTPVVEPGKKNAFSGNAAFVRDDFLWLGGMDEEFVNYGCSDADFTLTVLQSGMEIRYVEEEELHLWHPKDMTATAFWLINTKSAFRLSMKWGMPVEKRFMDYAKDNKCYCMM